MNPREIAEAALADLDNELSRLRAANAPALSVLSSFAGTADAVRAMLPPEQTPWLADRLKALAIRHALPITDLFQ
ncbi:hypothetical protein [Luteimonas abyssi]|uniref:hypothetical protein n=1 Tax=Luteimonas abyssi TaxID=1247514 RepID=UPI000737C28D|nr:hypothetical protein [Luteimonas abyssi]